MEVAGVAERSASNPTVVMELLQNGNRYRKTEATMANQVSSRSHAVLQVIVRHTRITPSGRESLVESKLSLIDLAGSERASATNNTGARLTEGANINKSLLALANCINALSENSSSSKQGNVKFRDSKLTHLLRSSLEGNCSLIMIANINPSHKTFEDSHNTLKYANRAKNIKVDPTVTDQVKDCTWVEREARLRDENMALKSQISQLQQLLQQANSFSASTVPISSDMLPQLSSGPATMPEHRGVHSFNGMKVLAPRITRSTGVQQSKSDDMAIDLNSNKYGSSLIQKPSTAPADISLFNIGDGFEIENVHCEDHRLNESSNATFVIKDSKPYVKNSITKVHLDVPMEIEANPPSVQPKSASYSTRKRQRDAQEKEKEKLLQPLTLDFNATKFTNVLDNKHDDNVVEDLLQDPPVNKKRRGSFIPVRKSFESESKMDDDERNTNLESEQESFMVNEKLMPLCTTRDATKTLLGRASSHFLRKDPKIHLAPSNVVDENNQVSNTFSRKLTRRSTITPSGELDRKQLMSTEKTKAKVALSSRAALGSILNTKITAAYSQLRSSCEDISKNQL